MGDALECERAVLVYLDMGAVLTAYNAVFFWRIGDEETDCGFLVAGCFFQPVCGIFIAAFLRPVALPD